MRYAVISDVHLGQTNTHGSYSLLSSRAMKNPEYEQRVLGARKTFFEELENFKGEEELTLIVNGDYLDLSMGNNKSAYIDHVDLMNKAPIDHIFIVVGNHDHHLWTLNQIEKRELHWISNNLFPPYPGSVFDFNDESYFGEFGLVNDNSLYTKEKRAFFCYPSFELETEEQTFYFSHGHLFGGLYTTISTLLKEHLEGTSLSEKVLASVNAPLIEAIYWLLGQVGGPMGTRGLVSAVYNSVLEGKTSLVNQLVADGVDMLLPDGIVKGIPDRWERWVVKKVCKSVLKKVVKSAASPSSRNRHQKNDTTLRSVAKWAEEVYKPRDLESIIVSGHTHKICDGEELEIEVDNKKRIIHYYNTGSWLVEPNHRKPTPMMLKIYEDGRCESKIFDEV